jgi:hypothetical protein
MMQEKAVIYPALTGLSHTVILRCQTFPPIIALQKLFYKNGDAISGGGWDDTRLQKPGR